MEIYIDGQRADIDRRTNVSITLSVASLTRFGDSRTAYSKTIEIPMTARNNALLGGHEQLNAVPGFNSSRHTARIINQGCTVIEGVLVLSECIRHGAEGYYRVGILGPGREWVTRAAATPLRKLDVAYQATLSGETIRESWVGEDTPVRFLPVVREGFEAANPGRNLLAPLKILSAEDYHPFLHMATVIRQIFGQAGYAISSQFIDSAWFGSLYMSGNYPERDTDLMRSRMDFRAGRKSEVSAVADHLGRVYATPYSNLNTVGNIVETANPGDSDHLTGDLFTTGGYMRRNHHSIEFAPPTEVVVAFEMRIAYTTDFIVTGRNSVTGFDRVYIGGEQERRFELAMPYEERSGQLVGYKTFKIMIFDYKQGDRFRMDYREITNPDADPDNLQPGDYTERSTHYFLSKSTTFTINTTNRITAPRLIKSMAGVETEYAGDWGIYDGNMLETGTMEVEVTLRTEPRRVAPSAPATFHDIYFGGAKPGMNITLQRGTTLRPVFIYAPAEGTRIGFGDVAAHEVSCLDVVNAVKHMFDLHFITDDASRTVYIEPRGRFYAEQPVIDLSRSIDLSRPVAVGQAAGQEFAAVSFRYADGDRPAYGLGSEQLEFGQWDAAIENAAAANGTKVMRNPLFAPTVSVGGAYRSAPDAVLLRVGRSDDRPGERNERLNFSPRIVRYLGMKPLPDGQVWGWPANSPQYPFAAFHYPGDKNTCQGSSPNPLSTYTDDPAVLWDNGLSLCFDDRDGVAGIHRFRDHGVQQLSRAKRLEAYVMLYPHQIEPFVVVNSLRHDFRALYTLTLDGEQTPCRLEEICDYNPAATTPTRCVFVQEV